MLILDIILGALASAWQWTKENAKAFWEASVFENRCCRGNCDENCSCDCHKD